MDDDKENRKVTFNFGYFYTCAFCTKVLTDRSELEEHLEDDHDDEDVDESFIDGPMFRVRKIQFYLDKVSRMILLTRGDSYIHNITLICIALY